MSPTREAVAGEGRAVGRDLEIIAALQRVRRRRWWCRAPVHRRLDLARQPVDAGRSGPKTLTPTGVRMPVASMSMRALIGMVQALLTPGNCSASSISAISVSTVTPGRHCSLGLQIDHGLEHLDRRRIGRRRGAARLAEHARHFGKALMMRSCVCSSSAALVTDMPGT